MIDLNKEYGLVLAGGGAKGSFQIGVWKALKELEINVKGVVGTSVGALNGILFAQEDYEKAYDLWSNISYHSVLNIDNEKEFDNLLKFNYKELGFESVIDRMKKIAKQKGFETSGLRKIIEESVDFQKARNSGIEFGLVTFSLTDFKPIEIFLEDMKDSELVDYLLASSNLPIFKNQMLNGKHLIDGGFYSVSPTELLLSKGYKDIIVVKLSAPGIEQRYVKKDALITTIEPKEDLGKMMEFSKDKALNNMIYGYHEAMKTLTDLDGDYYYIRCNKSEKYFISRLTRLKAKSINKLVRGMINYDYPKQRYLLEQGVPYLARQLKLSSYWTYRELVITILEVVAKIMEIERFSIYEYDEFVRIIKSNIEQYKKMIEYDNKSTDIYHFFVDVIAIL